MITALTFASSIPGSSPSQEHCVVSLRDTLFSVSISSDVYELVLVNVILGGNRALD